VEPRAGTHDAQRLVELVADAGGRGLRLDSPIVGRARQLAALQEALATAVADRACQLFSVLGVAGVGKSRLLGEFLGGLGDEATILQGRCLSYGEAITFWPLIEAVRGSTGLDDAGDAPAAGSAMDSLVFSREDTVAIGARSDELMRLIEEDAPADETFGAASAFFEAAAGLRPLVVAFDDLHWAEPVFLDLVEHVAERARDAPILIVCSARPELLDDRPAWGGGKVNSRSILLEPLSEEESDQLVGNLLGGSDLPRAVRRYIVGTAEGNPLFVEELLGSLIDQAVLRREGETWTTVELPALVIPPSIQALLSSRIDRLPDDQRLVLELASIEGRRFHREAVAHLAPGEARGEIDSHLAALAQRDLIRPRSGRVHSFSFRHQLLRDAAYESIPKQARAELHERFAAWLERKAGDRIAEVEEILGYHLEQAYELRAEIGPADEQARRIAVRAAARLESAGRRAAARGDERGAARLLRRAEALIANGELV
jgi:predicted ATPase